MDRLLADDAVDVALVRDEADALGDENLRIPAADRRDVDEALVVDVLDDEADLVDVAVEHDRRRPCRIDDGDTVAGDIATHFGRERTGLIAPDSRGCGLEARRSRRVEQTPEKDEGGVVQHVVRAVLGGLVGRRRR
jgi:hypothetical protein